MSTTPHRPGFGPGRAADDNKAEQEHRLYASFAAQTQDLVADLGDIRFERAVARLHRLGPRPLYEMLVDLAARRLLGSEIEEAVNRFAALDPVMVEAVGGDRFAPIPLHLVGGGP